MNSFTIYLSQIVKNILPPPKFTASILLPFWSVRGEKVYIVFNIWFLVRHLNYFTLINKIVTKNTSGFKSCALLSILTWRYDSFFLYFSDKTFEYFPVLSSNSSWKHHPRVFGFFYRRSFFKFYFRRWGGRAHIFLNMPVYRWGINNSTSFIHSFFFFSRVMPVV